MAEATQTAGAFEEGRILPETQLAAEFYDRTPAALFGIPSTEFGQILYAIARKYLPEGSTQVETRQFCSALRLDDLVLARGCAAGNEKAWEVFLTRFREKLYEMALRIAREPSAAQDLSDSLYGDLYGLTSSDRIRASKLISYTGRGSLEGWLRTVLAQEFINRYRKNKRLVSLDETDPAHVCCQAVDFIYLARRPKAVVGHGQVQQQKLIGARRCKLRSLDIDASDPVAALDEVIGQMVTDETAGAGHQHSLLLWHSELSYGLKSWIAFTTYSCCSRVSSG